MFSIPNATSRSTRERTICSSGSWKTLATVPASSAGRTVLVSRPAISTRPSNRPPWKCGTSPANARNSVDLPEPDWTEHGDDLARFDLQRDAAKRRGAGLRIGECEPVGMR